LLLEIHTKKLRRKIARHSTLTKTSARNMLELSLKEDNPAGEILMTTNEDLLSGTQNKNSEFENSYLLTELESESNRPSSPGGVLNTSGNLRKKRGLKTEELK
jgi:hypothetical protein